jgi:hypothetical protein
MLSCISIAATVLLKHLQYVHRDCTHNLANLHSTQNANSCSIHPCFLQYVSFVEITAKAVGAFAEAGLPDHEAARYATFSFFLGVVATWLLGKLVDFLATAARVIRARKVCGIINSFHV